MATYNTYQEAKIENPECEIYWYLDGGLNDSFTTLELRDFDTKNNKCNPADYCMTVEKFLADGHEVFMGDAIINANGNVNYITQGDAKMINSEDGATFNNARYILRSSALENIPTETPEEKEVLDSIDSAGDAEWKNGDECVIRNDNDRYSIYDVHKKHVDNVGIVRSVFKTTNGTEIAAVQADNGDCVCWRVDMLKKPETPQQREERERACAIYDMCAEADIFTEESNFWAGKFYDLGYKKEKSNGTN